MIDDRLSFIAGIADIKAQLGVEQRTEIELHEPKVLYEGSDSLVRGILVVESVATGRTSFQPITFYLHEQASGWRIVIIRPHGDGW